MARQFNLIPPVCEQAEYHYFQRDKVEVQLPELYHKIGQKSRDSRSLVFKFLFLNLILIIMCSIKLSEHSFRCGSNDLVSTRLWINHREIQRRSTRVLQSGDEGQSDA